VRFLEASWANAATADRPFLVAAHRASEDLDAIAALDRSLEAMTLPRELREGGRRAGARCSAFTKRWHGRRGRVRGRVRAARRPGHLRVPALLWPAWPGRAHRIGSYRPRASVSVVSAALRLSVITTRCAAHPHRHSRLLA